MFNTTRRVASWMVIGAVVLLVIGVGPAAAGQGYFGCALTTSGGVKCWGMNQYGQVGNGTFSTWPTTGIATPAQVTGLTSGVVQVTTGVYHACALTITGGVKCWGLNAGGQLGIGTLSTSSPYGSATPVDVMGLTSNVVQISANGWHTCALMNSGGVKCWGYNDYGQLGNGTITTSFPPGIPTPGDVIGLSASIAEISAGLSHTCAVTVSGGVVCWGQLGQLGDGGVWPPPGKATPVDVSGLASGVAHISASFHTCAVTTSGDGTCWGPGTATPAPVSGLSGKVAQISAGGYHTCAVMANGRARCWGSNFNGQLGTGTFVDSGTPVDVVGLSNDISQISLGLSNTCALTTSGDTKCWGYNFDGELGNGTFSTTYPDYNSATPVDVIGFTHDVAELWDGEPFVPDSIAPTAHPAQSPTADGGGWNTTDVVVTWNWLDDGAGSGIDASDCGTSSTSSGEGNPITLTATCSDLAGNKGTASYDVKVDRTAPVITVPGPLYDVNATGPQGAVVDYPVTVVDALDPSPTLSCSPASGSFFLLLFTAVTCTASDGAGNSADATFDILVKPADWQLFDTINLVESWNLGKLGSSLLDKLRTARKFNEAGKTKQANDTLIGLLSQIASQSGKGLTTEQADELIARVTRIQHVLGY